MLIKDLYLKDWRNGEENILSFSPQTTLICGENAAGKTNILEGICFFAAGKSFRGCKDKELIRFGCDSSAADITYVSNGVTNKMGVRLKKNAKKTFLKNGAPISKMSEFLGAFRCVIFTPDHLDLVKGAPEGRRRFTDMAICQSFPRHVAALNEYNRLLIQKNAHLKGNAVFEELLEVYDERMAVLAANITVNRRKYIKALEESGKSFLYDMSEEREELSLTYITQSEGEKTNEIKESYLGLFKEKRGAEIEKRMTLCGPQKDDISIHINRKSAKSFCSQGQQRSIVLALKLAEGEISRSLTGEYPVFLLDDVLSELDENRRDYILKRIEGRQVIITGCDENMVDLLPKAQVIKVENGRCL
ncbi:MAG: DNA replication/repair protein RecF [Ruminococcaceae bacterium]|nr:DNA replication/repair protein RecF [Oscillospiraceae bacterium]